jgi:hypothetical protein
MIKSIPTATFQTLKVSLTNRSVLIKIAQHKKNAKTNATINHRNEPL